MRRIRNKLRSARLEPPPLAAADEARCLRANPYWLALVGPLLIPELRKNEAAASPERDAAAVLLAGVSYANHGQLERALALTSLAAQAPGAAGEWWHNVGVLEAQLHRPARAVEAFRRATMADPECGPPWAALALIYALAGYHAAAERAARQALALKANVGNDVVSLCLMQSAYARGSPDKGNIVLPSTSADTGKRLQRLMGKLPATIPGDLRLPGGDAPIVFIACDHAYLLKHAVALVWSLCATGWDCAVHLHLMNPEENPDAIARELERRAARTVSVSAEWVSLEPGRRALYYSSVRFCRLYQLCNANPGRAFVFLDADVLLRSRVDSLPGFADSSKHIGLLENRHEPMWQRISGCLGWVKPSPIAREYLALVALLIADNLTQGKGRWFLDQVALLVAYDRLAKKEAVALGDASAVVGMLCEPGASAWAIATAQPISERYSQYKDELLGRYGQLDLGSERA